MISELFGFSGLLAVQFGFAAFLGGLAGYARQAFDRALVVASLLFYTAASLALPMAIQYKVVIWLVSALLFWGFRNSNIIFRAQPRMAWLYTAFAMALIIGWSLVQPVQSPLAALAAGATLAAALAWRRGLASA
jgi:hypothetical protein